MAPELYADERIIYSEEYCKKRKVNATVTVTDRRLISTVDSKRRQSVTSIDVKEIGGVSIRFKPASVLLFIIGFILVEVSGMLFSNISNLIYDTDVEGISVRSIVLLFVFIAIYAVIALYCLISGAFKIRNGFYISIKIPANRIDMINMSAKGKYKAIKLKPKREEAQRLMRELSSALSRAKYGG